MNRNPWSRRTFIGAGAGLIGFSSAQGPSAAPPFPTGAIPTADLYQSQLFLDDTWIESASRLERVWEAAELFPEPVLRPEAPWEGRQVVLYGSVFRLAGEWRMYYMTYNPPLPSWYCLATSRDGIRWERPNLGRVEFQGSKANNIVWAPGEGERHDGPSLCHDPEDTARPFKMMVHIFSDTKKPAGQYVAFSRDGIDWTTHPTAVLTSTGDRTNLLSGRDHRGKFVAYLRHRDMMKTQRARTIWWSESEDFFRWSEPELLLKPDWLDDANTELYGMCGFRHAGLYLGLLERWYGNPDVVEVQVAWSRDGRQWQRPEKRSAFIEPRFPWNRRWNSCAGTPPIREGNQLWFYFGGRSAAHGKENPQSYGAVGLATLTADRFAAIRADFKEGELLTRPMLWPEGDLVLNATLQRYPQSHPSSGGGRISIEVRDESNRPLEAWSGSRRAEHTSSRPGAKVVWPEGRSLREMAGRQIRLAFLLQDARLYSFQCG